MVTNAIHKGIKLLLKTHESWQVKSDRDFRFDNPGDCRYRLFEVVLNMYLFHVDILPKHEDPCQQLWSRFIFCDIGDVLPFIGRADLEEVRISLQSRRCDNDDKEYAISTISEIIECKDETDQPVHIYRCKSGKSYISCTSNSEIDDLVEKKTIYIQSNNTKKKMKPSSVRGRASKSV